MINVVLLNLLFIKFINSLFYYLNIYYVLLLEKNIFVKLNFKNFALYTENIIHPVLLILFYLYILKNIFWIKKNKNNVYSIFFLLLAFIGGMFWFLKTKKKIWLWDYIELCLLFFVIFFVVLIHSKLIINFLFIPLLTSLYLFYFFVSFSNHKFTNNNKDVRQFKPKLLNTYIVLNFCYYSLYLLYSFYSLKRIDNLLFFYKNFFLNPKLNLETSKKPFLHSITKKHLFIFLYI